MRNRSLSLQKNPNPQGKGCVAVLQDWAALRPVLPATKAAPELVRDYCLSTLVLAATFRFKPVVGKAYFLYSTQSGWILSLVGPLEWGSSAPGDYVARCLLRNDATWDLAFTQFSEESPVPARLEAFVEGFSESVAGDGALADALPFYAPTLPYYQRMLATGLAVSLQHSISLVNPSALKRALPSVRIG